MSVQRWSVEWTDPAGVLRAVEPTPDEVAAVASTLAAHYNDAHNRAMMAHADEMSVEDVHEHYQRLWGEGGRPFLLEQDGALLGDADLRGLSGTTAEMAIMVGPRAAQGQGLGTRFALMVHALAFGVLGIERVFVSIIPGNRASRRLFEKLGYTIDDSPEARRTADEAGDVTMSLTRARFDELHGAAARQLRITPRA